VASTFLAYLNLPDLSARTHFFAFLFSAMLFLLFKCVNSYIQAVNGSVCVILGASMVLYQVLGPAYCGAVFQVQDTAITAANVIQIVLLLVADFVSYYRAHNGCKERTNSRKQKLCCVFHLLGITH
jgi:hypothetical protein